jgi:hypothetical protein
MAQQGLSQIFCFATLTSEGDGGGDDSLTRGECNLGPTAYEDRFGQESEHRLSRGQHPGPPVRSGLILRDHDKTYWQGLDSCGANRDFDLASRRRIVGAIAKRQGIREGVDAPARIQYGEFI